MDVWPDEVTELAALLRSVAGRHERGSEAEGNCAGKSATVALVCAVASVAPLPLRAAHVSLLLWLPALPH